MVSERSELFKRSEKNPIVTVLDLPVPANSVFNSGVIKVGRMYAMMLRIEDMDRKQHFRMAYSETGTEWRIEKDPVIFDHDEELQEYNGFYYDPRITYVAEEQTYYINFAVHSDLLGVRGGQVKTKDFKRFEWIGFGTEPDCRNCVLFPEKINGLYARLDRPHGKDGTKNNIWISYSPDLVYWGKSKVVATTRPHHWDDAYVGPGAVPIKTKEGWLEIYHGVYRSCSGAIYRLGVLLLDMKDPSCVIGRCNGYVLGPRELYERVGDVPNVVFTSGAVAEDDGTVNLFYGAADTVMCLATAQLGDLLAACREAR
ncbi:MAG: glycoside hydrolase family 130 protein [Deltaproteobacteria bacterium]|nr:glycoside hydrolase family 130 protein [Deltaproteobacteria bacterium]